MRYLIIKKKLEMLNKHCAVNTQTSNECALEHIIQEILN